MSKEMFCRPLRVGTSVIIKSGGRILLGYRVKEKHWEFPGGKVELGEKVMNAAKREAEEETGLHVGITFFCGYYEHTGRWNEADWLNMIFEAQSTGLPKVTEPDKFTEWKWFPMSEMPLAEMWDAARHVFVTWLQYYASRSL